MPGGLHIPDSEVYLAKAGTKVGTNKANGTLLPFTLAYSSYYGGATDLWGTTWTPAEINDPMFGAMIRFETEDSTVSVDNCELSVYWH